MNPIMKMDAIRPMWKASLAGLAMASALLSGAVAAAEEVAQQTLQSLQTPALTPSVTWKTVPTQTISAKGISFGPWRHLPVPFRLCAKRTGVSYPVILASEPLHPITSLTQRAI